MTRDHQHTPPRRRWYQFGLRTMFVVVTVVAIFVAYHVNWIRQRCAIVDAPKTDAFRCWANVDVDPFSVATPKLPRAPGLLWLFGEPGYANLAIEIGIGETWCDANPEEQAELDRIQRLFPEAEITSISH